MGSSASNVCPRCYRCNTLNAGLWSCLSTTLLFSGTRISQIILWLPYGCVGTATAMLFSPGYRWMFILAWMLNWCAHDNFHRHGDSWLGKRHADSFHNGLPSWALFYKPEYWLIHNCNWNIPKHYTPYSNTSNRSNLGKEYRKGCNFQLRILSQCNMEGLLWELNVFKNRGCIKTGEHWKVHHDIHIHSWCNKNW